MVASQTELVYPKSVLRSEEIKALRPEEREDYVRAVILEILRKNENGVTISEVMNVTKFNRVTVTKHLEYLVATREAYKKERGIGTIYFKNGKLVHETDKLSISCDNRIYQFFRLENPDGVFIYIQEQEKDEFRAINVKGGIMIPIMYFQRFMDGLSRFCIQASESERSENK
jgi:predicted transcriptional regulator